MRRGAVLAAMLAALLCEPALAQDRAAPGGFEFYVLSLSWSPTYCRENRGSRDAQQCRSGRPFGFIVHGLWPQHESGFPESCAANAPRVSDATMRAMRDIMPSNGLIIHQWRKHGTCTGLTPDAYFEATRDAFSRVEIPGEFRDSDRPREFAPIEIENAFIRANAGLGRDMIAVDCRDRLLREVRICLDKSFGFRACPEVDRRACRTPRIEVPPVRG